MDISPDPVRNASEPPVPLSVAHSPSRERAVLTASGELDLATCPDLRSALAGARRGGASTVVVDLGAVTFVDSSVLGVLVEAHRALVPGQRMQVTGASGLPLRVLQLTGLDGVLDVVRSPQDDAALRAAAQD